MKKMFSVLVLALSLSLNVNAQQASATSHVTVTPHVTTAPHVSAPAQVSKPTATATLPGKVTAPVVTVNEPNVSKPTVPVTVTSPVVSNSTLDTSKTKSIPTEVKQADSLPPVPTNTNSTPWGFVGIVIAIVGIIIYVTINQKEDAAEATPKLTVAPSEPEVTTKDATEVKENTKQEPTK